MVCVDASRVAEIPVVWRDAGSGGRGGGSVGTSSRGTLPLTSYLEKEMRLSQGKGSQMETRSLGACGTPTSPQMDSTNPLVVA